MREHWRNKVLYTVLLAASFLVALAASWTAFGKQIDNYAYDWIFRIYRPAYWEPESVVLAIDEESLTMLGKRELRRALAQALETVTAASPQAVAVDLILADTDTPEADRVLESAFCKTPKLILSSELFPGGKSWEDPLDRFRRCAVALAHVHAQPDPLDSVTREIPLEKATQRERRWALALETFRVSRGGQILESPKDLQVANVTIPSDRARGRTMRVRYRPPEMPPIPRVSLKQLHDDPRLAALFSGKVVFVGVTAQTQMRDRPMTPYSFSSPVPGVEVHAAAFETIAHRLFLTPAPEWLVLLFSTVLVLAVGLVFAYLAGWRANLAAGGILIVAHVTPYALFRKGMVFPVSTAVASAWLSSVSAAAFQHLVVRRRLRKSEADRVRYQETIHFVTHEMRTPLTAIQGSSELMSRYALSDEKRKQIAQLINSESKRLARMIEMFLTVERLSAGQMELKKEPFSAREVMSACAERVRPLADRKQILVTAEPVPDCPLLGDRELMEYAFYNLLTNAVKYSPPRTEVTVFGSREGDRIRVSVQDQGIGMDQKEIGKVFEKFYRTKRAEESGEAGAGIGLSIVEQIVIQHGGKIEVTSRPGQGSRFTLVLPVRVSVPIAEHS